MRLIKWLVILGVLVGLLAAAGFAAKKYLNRKPVAQFATAKVTTGKIETVVNSTGPIKPVQSVLVGSFVSGPIKDIFVDHNAKVTKNQLLAEIDPRLLQATLDREKAAFDTQVAELARIDAQLSQAVNNENRALELRKSNPDFISDQEMDNLKFTRAGFAAQKLVAEASIKAAQASLDNAKTNLGYTKIVSPVDGIVIDRKVEMGQTLASLYQTPEMFVIAPDMEKHMHIYASVDEADIGQIRKAQEQNRPVKFTQDSFPDEVFTGRIHQIRMSGTTTQNVVTYPVIVEAPNPELKLLPLMTANLSFQTDIRENVVRIPTAAMRFVPQEHLIRPEDKVHIEIKPKKDPKEGEPKLSAEARAEQAKARAKRVVWKQVDGVLVAVPITIGLMDGQFAELLTGDVKVDDLLVTGLYGEADRAGR